MEKFKVGQRVYCIMYGPGEVYALEHLDDCPVKVRFKSIRSSYTVEGLFTKYESMVNPILLTLEEARAKGYDVPKQKIVKEKTVYINLYSDGRTFTYDSEYSANAMSTNIPKAIVVAYPVTIKYEVEE